MPPDSFQEVSWCHVCDVLHEVLCPFQLWAYKQVMNVVGTNLNQSIYRKGHDPCCPSCSTELEFWSHFLYFGEMGQVNSLQWSIGWLDKWLKRVCIDQTLHHVLVQYARD